MSGYFPASMNQARPNRSRYATCFQEWMLREQLDVEELSVAGAAGHGDSYGEAELRRVVASAVQHGEAYCEKRAGFAREDAVVFYSPAWCSSLEVAHLWIAGCRSTLFIQLLYTISGLELAWQIDDFIHGGALPGKWQLTVGQMELINSLHLKTIDKEDKLSRKLASLQEKVANKLPALIGDIEDNDYEEIDRELDVRSEGLGKILEVADELLINTLKELIEILTPVQAVNLLLQGRKLKLSIHECGNKKDYLHGQSGSHNV